MDDSFAADAFRGGCGIGFVGVRVRTARGRAGRSPSRLMQHANVAPNRIDTTATSRLRPGRRANACRILAATRTCPFRLCAWRAAKEGRSANGYARRVSESTYR